MVCMIFIVHTMPDYTVRLKMGSPRAYVRCACETRSSEILDDQIGFRTSYLILTMRQRLSQSV
jgi:hypothetical protein